MVPNKKLSTPCATNRLSYEFTDDLDQIGGISTFKRDLSEGNKIANFVNTELGRVLSPVLTIPTAINRRSPR